MTSNAFLAPAPGKGEIARRRLLEAAVEVFGEKGLRGATVREIAKAAGPIVDQLDHYYLNEIEGLSNPTSENLSRWLWEKLKPSLPMLTAIVVYETCTSACEYCGE